MAWASGSGADDDLVSVHSQSPAQRPECWCCGKEFDERDLVRLLAHPEVGICLDCARYAKRRASHRHSELHPSPGARVAVGVAATTVGIDEGRCFQGVGPCEGWVPALLVPSAVVLVIGLIMTFDAGGELVATHITPRR